jgi:hypothetical protein
MAADEPEQLDLDQFRDVEDALDQLANSRVYENVLKLAFQRAHRYSDLTIFAQSASTRFRGLHEGVMREVKASNPHAVFPLMRAFAETVAVVAYANDYPDYVERVAKPRGGQPKQLKRPRIETLIDHIAPDAPGFARIYDQLCEITHFGSLALWHPHSIGDDQTVRWRSAPQWRNDRESLIACAQLKEMSDAAATYLHNFAGRHILEADDSRQ